MFQLRDSLHIAVKSLIFCLVLVIASFSADAADLEVTIQGLRNGDGMMRLALFDKAEEFPRGQDIRDHDVAAKPGNIVVVFKDLKPGTYALAIHHDENTNSSMDTNFIGLPLEGYGFSNNAPVFFGPPSFEAAAFKVGDGKSKISLKVVY